MERLKHISNQLSINKTTHSDKKVQIEYIFNNRIGIITFNSPKDLNALSKELESQFLKALKQLDQDESVKVIILLSNVPKAFCAGIDITRFSNVTNENLIKSKLFENYDNKYFKITKPIISGVNGFALGGGFEIALGSDIIFCSQEAKFGFPEIKLGLIPGIGGTQRFTKIVGKIIANYYILSGEFLDAQTAKNLNIVAGIFSNDKLREEVIKYAEKIAMYSSYSIIVGKNVTNQAEELSISEGIKYERRMFYSLFNLPGAKEGIDAFNKKRKANFDGI
ncbi:hypothetical protein IMG5_187560 [Ichthyophthirius multifiliis]|uniref:Enoyl-CoA hydratase n=1 Tax=Ichthyophthirius multifiliis TaxID=5932 RepID=G0R3U4_ICHMU|nr:hypothetical protein IMG5_187560 [Ichthyophthirius multifiliis]EGR27851.1 hypothetical protein IMG5_187560 [Ichthyophthirius multifiliis]|eukprot:XP_004027196.1 hypothetical protein IMG5_187560 [Ichthyophthirius multifiliis]